MDIAFYHKIATSRNHRNYINEDLIHNNQDTLSTFSSWYSKLWFVLSLCPRNGWDFIPSLPKLFDSDKDYLCAPPLYKKKINISLKHMGQGKNFSMIIILNFFQAFISFHDTSFLPQSGRTHFVFIPTKDNPKKIKDLD